MKNKALTYKFLFYIVIISFLFLNSCEKTIINVVDVNMNIVGNLGVSSAYLSYDTTVLSGAVEMAVIIGQFNISNVEQTGYIPGSDFPIFTYTASIEELYFDRDDKFNNKKEITFISSNGYIKASDYINDMQKSERAKKLGILDKDYNDNDYFICSWYDTIVYEPNKTYMIFLCDNGLGDYVQASDEYLYEISADNLLKNADKKTYDKTLAEFENELKTAVKNRKGELDQGLKEYFKKKNAE
ncbi:MAG: hypothetical protein AB9835_01480 [Eubacteriales bacterium]